MDEFNSELFSYSTHVDLPEDATTAKDQAFFISCPTSTTSYQSVTPQVTPFTSYDIANGFFDDEAPESGSHNFAFSFVPGNGLEFESFLPTGCRPPIVYTARSSTNLPSVSSSLPDAENQGCAVQGAGVSHFSPQLQASDNLWKDFDMADIVQHTAEDVRDTAITRNTENTSLQCIYSNCHETKTFASSSALRRHEDKHVRPYICPHTSCNRRNFGDKGGLERHSREVHGSHTYNCPILSCKRNTRGFHRKYNLFEHQKRAHSLLPSKPSRTRSNTLEEPSDVDGDSTNPPVERPDGKENKQSFSGFGDDTSDSKQGLRAKLRDLQALRNEIDEDITSLQRVLSMMDSGSP